MNKKTLYDYRNYGPDIKEPEESPPASSLNLEKINVVSNFLKRRVKNLIDDDIYDFKCHLDIRPNSIMMGRVDPRFEVEITHKESGWSVKFYHDISSLYKQLVLNFSHYDPCAELARTYKENYMSKFKWIDEWKPIFRIYLRDGRTIEYETEKFRYHFNNTILIVMEVGTFNIVDSFSQEHWDRCILLDNIKKFVETD